jgi:hypothetical protein
MNITLEVYSASNQHDFPPQWLSNILLLNAFSDIIKTGNYDNEAIIFNL